MSMRGEGSVGTAWGGSGELGRAGSVAQANIQMFPAQEPVPTGSDALGREARHGHSCISAVGPGLHHRFLLYGDSTWLLRASRCAAACRACTAKASSARSVELALLAAVARGNITS